MTEPLKQIAFVVSRPYRVCASHVGVFCMIDDSVMLVVQRYDAEKRQMYGKIMSKR